MLRACCRSRIQCSRPSGVVTSTRRKVAHPVLETFRRGHIHQKEEEVVFRLRAHKGQERLAIPRRHQAEGNAGVPNTRRVGKMPLCASRFGHGVSSCRLLPGGVYFRRPECACAGVWVCAGGGMKGFIATSSRDFCALMKFSTPLRAKSPILVEGSGEGRTTSWAVFMAPSICLVARSSNFFCESTNL